MTPAQERLMEAAKEAIWQLGIAAGAFGTEAALAAGEKLKAILAAVREEAAYDAACYNCKTCGGTGISKINGEKRLIGVPCPECMYRSRREQPDAPGAVYLCFTEDCDAFLRARLSSPGCGHAVPMMDARKARPGECPLCARYCAEYVIRNEAAIVPIAECPNCHWRPQESVGMPLGGKDKP